MLVVVLASCTKSPDDEARPLMEKIEDFYAKGQYRLVLDSIDRLRADHPRAIECRKKALTLWQDASLKLAQHDIALTDSALQATKAQIAATTDLLTRNKLGVRRDSLQARYDAMCGVVRMIHARQKQYQQRAESRK